MSMPIKDRELVAVGISVAAGCKPCTSFHLGASRKAGRSRNEMRSVVAVAGRVCNEATEVMMQHALAHPASSGYSVDAGDADRIDILTAVGAAFAVNCTSSLAVYLEAAEKAGVSNAEIAEVVELARFIKQMGASHVERMVDSEAAESADDQKVGAVGCGC